MESYDNIIFFAHIKDEVVLFYKFITANSLVILLTDPITDRHDEIFNELMNEKRCTYVKLGDSENFNEHYALSTSIKNQIRGILNTFQRHRVITHGPIRRTEDPQNRALYEFMLELKIPDHHTIDYDENSNNTVDTIQRYYIKRYAENNKQFSTYVGVASKIRGLKLYK